MFIVHSTFGLSFWSPDFGEFIVEVAYVARKSSSRKPSPELTAGNVSRTPQASGPLARGGLRARAHVCSSFSDLSRETRLVGVKCREGKVFQIFPAESASAYGEKTEITAGLTYRAYCLAMLLFSNCACSSPESCGRNHSVIQHHSRRQSAPERRVCLCRARAAIVILPSGAGRARRSGARARRSEMCRWQRGARTHRYGSDNGTGSYQAIFPRITGNFVRVIIDCVCGRSGFRDGPGAWKHRWTGTELTDHRPLTTDL